MLTRIKNFVLNSIIKTAVRIDKRMGWYEDYSYETAPYCGHHHSGHNGRLTSSHYHEGYGGISLGNDWVAICADDYADSEANIYFVNLRNFRKTITSFKIVSKVIDNLAVIHIRYTRHGKHTKRDVLHSYINNGSGWRKI